MEYEYGHGKVGIRIGCILSYTGTVPDLILNFYLTFHRIELLHLFDGSNVHDEKRAYN